MNLSIFFLKMNFLRKRKWNCFKSRFKNKNRIITVESKIFTTANVQPTNNMGIEVNYDTIQNCQEPESNQLNESVFKTLFDFLWWNCAI